MKKGIRIAAAGLAAVFALPLCAFASQYTQKVGDGTNYIAYTVSATNYSSSSLIMASDVGSANVNLLSSEIQIFCTAQSGNFTFGWVDGTYDSQSGIYNLYSAGANFNTVSDVFGSRSFTSIPISPN